MNKTTSHKTPIAPLRFLKVRAVARLLGFDSTDSVHRFLRRTGLPFVMISEHSISVEEGPLMEWVHGHRMAYVKTARRPRLMKPHQAGSPKESAA